MVAKERASQEAAHDFGVRRRNEFTEPERGYYGRALREGQVRRPVRGAPRTINTLLWVFNVIGWLLLGAFMVWRVYVVYVVYVIENV